MDAACIARIGALTVLGLLFATGSNAQNAKATVAHPVTITTDPSPFRRDQVVTTTAAFTAPVACRDQGILLRVYDRTDNDSEPTFGGTKESKYLAQAGGLAPVAQAGTKMETSFTPIRVPTSASPKLYMVVWSYCEVRIPKGIDPQTEKIIWSTKLLGTRIGGATFHFECPNRQTLCAYRPD